MSAIAFDRKPLHIHIVQRVTHSRPPLSITAPPPVVARPYDGLADDLRAAAFAQSAATRGGNVAAFPNIRAATPGSAPADVDPPIND